jgi:hypothetical protein
LPPVLALWWLGFGIEVVWNRPRRPQQNGQVERLHGLLTAWAEPATCPDAVTWQTRLAWLVATQRERYPATPQGSRLAAWPALGAGGRPYDPTTEAAQWDLARVWAALAGGIWVRRVDPVGQISLYDRKYGVGRVWAGQTVWVRFDATTGEWVIRAADDTEVVRHPTAELTTDRICTLTLGAWHPAPSPTAS